MDHFDLCIIGSGPGGQKAAIQAGKLGRKVCVVEQMEFVGGVAIHTGTIPSKALREAIINVTRGKDHLEVRGEIKRGEIKIEDLLQSCQRIIAVEMEIVRGQLKRNGVELLTGQASFVAEHLLKITSATGEKEISADKFIIAVGTAPSRPDHIPFDSPYVFTSDDIVKLGSLPHSLVVMGAGVIGTEFASMFARLGVRVTLVDRSPQILSFLDHQVGEALQYHLRERGLTLRLGERLKTATESPIVCSDGEHSRDMVEVVLQSGKKLRADALLYCLGRQGATAALNLEAVSLEADSRGRITVDENYQTSNPDIYAVGDVIGFPALASTSMDQGRVAAARIFGQSITSRPQLFPYGIYSLPEISMVGQTEEELTDGEIPFEVGVANYREIARGQLIGDDVGLLKIIFHTETRRILGVHIIGTGATELIHIGQAVMALKGTITYFIETAFNYPTLAECYKVAALNGLNRLKAD